MVYQTLVDHCHWPPATPYQHVNTDMGHQKPSVRVAKATRPQPNPKKISKVGDMSNPMVLNFWVSKSPNLATSLQAANQKKSFLQPPCHLHFWPWFWGQRPQKKSWKFSLPEPIWKVPGVTKMSKCQNQSKYTYWYRPICATGFDFWNIENTSSGWRSTPNKKRRTENRFSFQHLFTEY